MIDNLPWSSEYKKIIYVNFGVKNYMNEDHRSFFSFQALFSQLQKLLI